MEQGEEKEPISKNTRFIITKEIFDHLYGMLKHEDEKANRILQAMAFIAVAAAALAIPFLEGAIGTELKLFHVNLGVFLFLIFLILISLGTLFILAALGPILHINSEWTDPEEEKKKLKLPSILNFKKIARLSVEEWAGYFKEAPEEDLYEKMCNDHIVQSHTFAKRTKYKAKCIKSSKIFFRLSLVALILFVLSGFCLSYRSFFYWTSIVFSAGSLEWAVEYYVMPQKNLKLRTIPCAVFALLFFLASFLFL